MPEQHPNIDLLMRFNHENPASAAEIFREDFVWHYFNPQLPDLEGDYVGVDGLTGFFQSLGAKTGGTFQVNPVSATPVGNELVVTQVRNTMTLDGESIAINAVVVWRFVGGKIAEAWDIPAVYELAESLALGEGAV